MNEFITLEQFVASMSYREQVQIIESYDKFAKYGHIGDEPIRVYATNYLQLTGIGDSGGSITIWMEMLASRCALHLARLYIQTQPL